MQKLWPTDSTGATGSLAEAAEITDAELEQLYSYPAYPAELTRPWVQVNFVASADGAVNLDGTSAGLSHPADKRILLLGRDLADVILVGAGTIRAEDYGGAKPNRSRRQRHGLAAELPIAVVTASGAIDPQARLFTDTATPPLIITTERIPPQRRADLANAGADIITCGEQHVDLPAALAELHRRGLSRIDCEGGAHLFGELIAEKLVDQLCLTIAPTLVGAGTHRIAAGRINAVPQWLTLNGVLHQDDFLMLRYRRRDSR